MWHQNRLVGRPTYYFSDLTVVGRWRDCWLLGVFLCCSIDTLFFPYERFISQTAGSQHPWHFTHCGAFPPVPRPQLPTKEWVCSLQFVWHPPVQWSADVSGLLTTYLFVVVIFIVGWLTLAETSDERINTFVDRVEWISFDLLIGFGVNPMEGPSSRAHSWGELLRALGPSGCQCFKESHYLDLSMFVDDLQWLHTLRARLKNVFIDPLLF